MCGRYVSPDTAAIERFWHIGRHNWRLSSERNYNVPPTTQVPIIVKAIDDVLELNTARWGLIPNWWKKDKPPSQTFNARFEEAAQKPTWCHSLRTMRCLMPACGWYEWNEQEKVKNAAGRVVAQPYFVYSPDFDVIAFAAMWSIWERPGALPVVSCALLSKAAAPSIAHIHHRMPIVLKPAQFDVWLSAETRASDVQHLMVNPLEDFEGYPVNTRVNSARNTGHELITRLD